MESFDTDAFIVEIQSEPAIWDYQSDKYSNRLEKTKAWEQVCLKFQTNFMELSSKKKNEIGKYTSAWIPGGAKVILHSWK